MKNEIQHRKQISKEMWTHKFSMRIFDAKGSLSSSRTREILQEFHHHGLLHVINTNLSTKEQFSQYMKTIGFGDQDQFMSGGRTSHAWQEKWSAPGLRNMDYYPPELYLLPNNEIQYQHFFPERIVFFCANDTTQLKGGRTFIHSSKAVEHYLSSKGEAGTALLDMLRLHGLTIETGFLDINHPQKASNYFQSWQERFASTSREETMAKCMTLKNEYDFCWWKEDLAPTGLSPQTYTLMTRITLPAYFSYNNGQHCLRFPRIALDAPSIKNGYRRFTLGNGKELDLAHQNLLLEAYLATREGYHWSIGDFILVDNIRYGHSRESFEGQRDVVLGMAGLTSISTLLKSDITMVQDDTDLEKCFIAAKDRDIPTKERYSIPKSEFLWSSHSSMRVFDAKGKLSLSNLEDANNAFNQYGALLITNTGINAKSSADIPTELLEGLGFGADNQFKWGGLTCGRTKLQYVSKLMRETDKYPKDKFLLPHNEILYQRFMPQSLLFFCYKPTEAGCGGRTFVHCAHQVEHIISASGADGKSLLDKMHRYGFTIETGFLDENHPQKKNNYFRSWQDRFDTKFREEALSLCGKSTYQFDECFWKEEPEKNMDGSSMYTLMTRITIPAFKLDERNNQSYMFFPRIALDGPMTHNGYRRFLLGNQEELSPAEIEILLKAFWRSRQGQYYHQGDILLVDNIKFSHSREPFIGDREIRVAMAGIFWTDDVINKNEWEVLL